MASSRYNGDYSPSSHSQIQQGTGQRAPSDIGDEISRARRADYVAFLSRHPFATDAYEAGFVTGVREDCSLQTTSLRNVDVPILMLDNDFNNPDLERYLSRFRDIEPEIGVVGDARSAEEAHIFVDAVSELKTEYPDATLIVVPKCHEAIDIIGSADVPGTGIVLGYSMGYSNILASDFSDYVDWRGRRVHLLGASPTKQWEVIQQLTSPTLFGDPPADIVGLDWNGAHKVAYLGECWSRAGWQRSDHLSIRETVKESLREMRLFWQERGVWPREGTTPVDRLGDAVRVPDDEVFANGMHISEAADYSGPDDWEDRLDPEDDETRPLEHAIVKQYTDGSIRAYRTETERKYVEYHEGLIER